MQKNSYAKKCTLNKICKSKKHKNEKLKNKTKNQISHLLIFMYKIKFAKMKSKKSNIILFLCVLNKAYKKQYA